MSRIAAASGAVLLIMTGLRIADPLPVTALRDVTFDTFQRLSPRPYGDPPVRVVDIDDRTLAEFGQWPWPRDKVADLVERLAGLGAATVAFDIIFSEPDRTSPARTLDLIGSERPDLRPQAEDLLRRLPDHDQALADAMAKVPVVLGYATTEQRNPIRPGVKSGYAVAGTDPAKIIRPFSGSVTSLALLEQAAKGVGSLSLGQDSASAVVRQIPLLLSDGQAVYSGLALEALRVAQGAASVTIRSTGASGEQDTGRPALVSLRVGQLSVPLTAEGELFLRYDRNRPERFVSARDVLDPRREAEVRPRIEGQIVFVGTSAAGLHDRRVTPLGETVAGVALHAQAAEQVVSQDFLLRPDWAKGLETAVTAIACALVALLLARLKATYAAPVICGAVGILIGGAWLAFSRLSLLVDPVYPALSAIVVYFAVTAILYFTSDHEKRYIRHAFRHYLAPELLAKLEAAPESLRLGGEIRTMTVMFLDIRGFTPISEVLAPEALVRFLNLLFSPLTNAIQAEKGIVDKYIGDSIMAFWNAPVDVPDHARHACAAALRMRQVVDGLNETDAFGFRRAGHPDLHVQIGVGINTGEVCVGNVGSEGRFNYSVVGDAVNVAARIESSCKQTGATILVSEDTARAAAGFALLEAGTVPLKGKSKAVRLFALVGDEAEAATGRFRALHREHRRMLLAVDHGDPAVAQEALDACRLLGGSELQAFYDALATRVGQAPSGFAANASAAQASPVEI